ncbi:MAG: hypothetical protein MUQ30_01360 [Anaerolineae bacterium]|nr:hypothetical protein [Anaerolineae bacterium]
MVDITASFRFDVGVSIPEADRESTAARVGGAFPNKGTSLHQELPRQDRQPDQGRRKMGLFRNQGVLTSGYWEPARDADVERRGNGLAATAVPRVRQAQAGVVAAALGP